MKKINLLDCTLRDGAYIVDSEFGESAIRGIIKRLQDAKVDVIECGWLKDTPHKKGTSFYHVPDDLLQYMPAQKDPNCLYVAMIDYNRYDLSQLPPCDGKTIDAIRVVFPRDKVDEGLALAEPIRQKGYQVFFQAANTLGYTDAEILSLIEKVNKIKPVAISVVDTFGAMYGDDLTRIVSLFDHNLSPDIMLGFHSHNNLQMSFALSIQFINALQLSGRGMILDASLCGMGRGAGNANTELVVGYLNDKLKCDYDLNTIMDTIDMYMTQFTKKYEWGYSTSYFVSGKYCSHVNNIAYLIKNHKTTSKDLKNIIESLDKDIRLVYDYDNLEKVYLDYMNKEVDDSDARASLKDELSGKSVALIIPGSSSVDELEAIQGYISSENAVVIGVNSILPSYKYDYVFFSNTMRYEYAKEANPELFNSVKKIVTSNITTEGGDNAIVINYNNLIKRGWKYFDNSTLLCLRLLDFICPAKIGIAGFDGLHGSDNYNDKNLETDLSAEDMAQFNKDIGEMMGDFIATTRDRLKLSFITESGFDIR